MSILIILIIIIASLVLYYCYLKEEDLFKTHGLPFKMSVPVLGSTWSAMISFKPFASVVQEIYNTNPEAKYVGLHHRMAPVIMIRDPELLKSIAIKHFDHFPDHRSFGSLNIDPFFAKNLLLLRGERWKEVRALLTPAFTSSKMKEMFKLMSECAANMADHLAALKEENNVIELKDIFTRFANDVFASCAFGISINSMVERNNKFYVLGKEILDLHGGNVFKLLAMILFPRFSKMLGLRIIRKEVVNFFEEVVSATIATRQRTGIYRPDFIQLMMENRTKLGPEKHLNNLDIASQAFTFYFGGFETTSTLLCFASHMLAVNPEIQKRLQEEIDQVLMNSNGEIPYETMNGMKYLEAVINETLRLYPVIPFTDRECVKPLELPAALPGLKPFKMEMGSHIWIPIYAIQRDPRYFDEPEQFDPSRFLNKEVNLTNSGAFEPFGIGPRICIGNRFAMLQSKVALFHILARCELKVATKTAVPLKLGNGGAFLKAENGFWLEIQPRNNQDVFIN
nr:cytochrome P450 9e2-like [Nomia melanderi]